MGCVLEKNDARCERLMCLRKLVCVPVKFLLDDDILISYFHNFNGVTWGFTMLSMKNKYVCLSSISSHTNFCNFRIT